MARSLSRVSRWLRAEIVIGFLLATIFWAGVLGWQAAYVPTSAEKQKCYESAEQAGRKSEECKNLWERTTSDPVAFFTFWLVVFTGGLTVSTVLLWLAGERQIELSRESAASQAVDMQQSISVARASANAAKHSAIIAERALTVVERAFLSIGDTSVVTIRQFAAIVDYRISFNIVNSGRTPARNYFAAINLAVLDGEIPADFRFPDRIRDLPVTGGVVGPKSRSFVYIDFFIQDAIDVFEGRKKALVYGWLEYDDVFSDSPRHRTEFAAEIRVFADPRVTPQVVYGAMPPILTIATCGRYNAYDDGCMYQPGQTPLAKEDELPPLALEPVVKPPSDFQPTSFGSMRAQFQYGAPGKEAE
ncbi:hypothetical protein [Bradyrhizobium sp. SZCCHNR1070]|uniref:hypothetical protein n=1 Tax=Bradyrhizobium sp. SZCCHNR1070 TaxID=3057361 RepID=UPI002915C92B|nr:hypothetical protein [Bradyrhizobium sp. SZCCHNR1070]